MPKIILFNGPPRSGKDTATKFALEHLGSRAVHYRFAEPLKDAVHSLFGMSGIMIEHFDAVKNVPTDAFFGMSPREAYIWLSEEVAKPKFGKDFFTKIAIKEIEKYDDHIIVISDCGFNEEVEGLRLKFGSENIRIVYLERQGATYQNDSRTYISAPYCQTSSIVNNGSFEELRKRIIQIIDSLIGEENAN